ncbi:tenascin-X [Heterocephalus glaber]|uniref:Tenascin-X n=1 Tax=Heterocephalus glaber TaxID=10181 RepID=A0AAX6T579_HETGA|nr:tenascin-X [Heterocephalus glaber]
MPAPGTLTSSLALLLLLAVARAGPFSPRPNVTLEAPRPPPHPGGRAAGAGEGSRPSQHYEHTVEGGEKQVVFTHRINLPPSGGCGCAPGAEPPAPASEVQALRVRLEVLEELVKGLKEQCSGGCCPSAAQAGTGQTDVRSLCSLHGVFDLGRCACSCEPGWGGPTCSDLTGTPASSPTPAPRSCPDDCNDQGRCVRGRCVCFPGYAGPSCSWPSCPGDCQGRGRCVQGACVCRAGFSGPDCSQRVCPRGCSQRGLCVDGRCVCDPGYSGEDCGARACPWDCGEGGRCVDGRCVCWPGYAGEDCGTRTCPRDCRGRGRCEDGECICDAGYSGDDCGVRSCPGDCSQRGRCEDGRCVCWPGYSGPDCGARACPRDCRGRGRCEDGVCVCHAGFAGEDCGVRGCPGDCRGRGRCESGRCVCWPGYTGRDCGSRACPGDCRGHGRCVDGVCVCDAGFAGEDCGSRRCPGDCSGRGRCENGVCVCEPGYTGPSCAVRTCPADCRGRGRCVQGVCVCHAGYGGEDCGEEEPPAGACPGGCGPRELCRAGQCVCVEGFRGPDCAIQTCPGDCRGRGECRQGGCVCLEGYAGEDCGEEVPAIEGMRMHLLEETTVRTEWTPAPGPVDAYEIQFIPTVEGGGPPFTARVPSSASAYDQRGLAPGQEYQVTVRALRGTSWGPPASKAITTMIDGPQDLRVVAVTPTTLELSWLRPLAEVDRFVVSYVSAGNQRVRLEVPPKADGTLLTDLMPGVEYVVTVTAERGRAVSYPASVRANTGTSPLGATDEPPPAGPSTTQGAEAPLVQRPQELGELTALGRDEMGRLHVAWTAQPDTFDHFRLHLQVPEGSGVHEELLPGDVRQALVPPPPPGAPYRLLLYGILPGNKPSVPIAYRGIMDEEEEEPRRPPGPPRLEELTVTTGLSSDSLLLRWTVAEGEFDSFVIQYKDKDGPQVVPVEGSQRSALVTALEPGRKYKFALYGLAGKKKHGPLVAEARILLWKEPSPETPPRLGNLWVTDPTADSLRVTWTVPEGQFDSFMIQYRGRDGRPQVVPVEGPERSATISSLDPDHKYRFSLFGIAHRKRYGPLTADGTTAPERKEEPPPEPPEPPEQPLLGELAVTSVTPDSLRLSWTVARGPFDSFVVQYKDAQGQPRAVQAGDNENELLVPGLESNRKYKMNLYGLRGRQRVGPVSVVAKTAPQEMPDPTEPSTEALKTPREPRLGELTVTDATPDSLSLSWTVPEGQFDHFLVQYRDGDGQPKACRENLALALREQGATEAPGSLWLQARQTMEVGLKEEVPLSPAPAPQPEETPPATEPPLEPRLGELTVTEVTPNSVGLAWTVPEGEFDSFVVQYKDREGQPQEVPVASDQLRVTVPTLEPGRRYQMDLYGLRGQHRVGPLSVVAETDPLPPAPVTEPPLQPRLGELTVRDVTPDSVGLLWTVPEGEFDSFVVQYKDKDGQPQLVPVTAGQREVTVPGLESSRKYKFLLFGIQDGKRRSPVSVEAKTALRGDPSPEAPPRLGELWVTDPTPDSLRLSWTVPEGRFDSFVVQFKSKDGPQAVPVEGHVRSVTVSPLDAGRKYRFLLYGLLGRKRLGPLAADGATEPLSAMDPPREQRPPKPQLGEELQVTGVTPDSVGLAWTVPQGQFDSFVVQYRDSAGQPRVVPVDGSLREVRILGLDPARRYKLLLYGLLHSKRVGPLSAIAMTAPGEDTEAEPEAPGPVPTEPRLGELTVEEATPHSLRLSWEVAEGELDAFEVQYTDRDGQPHVVNIEGHQQDVTLAGLESEHRYLVTLYGFHDGQRVGPVHIEALTLQQEEEEPREPPTTPEPAPKPRLGELTVTDTTPDSLSLSWTVPEGQFDHFLVQYRDGDGQPKWTVAQGRFDAFTVQYKDGAGRPQVLRVGAEARAATVRGLDAGRKYKLNLYGLHQDGRTGPVSVMAMTAPVEVPPDVPLPKPRLGELTVTDATPDSLSLSWTVPEGQFDHFLVQYRDGDGQPKVVQVPGHKDEVTVSGLEPDHKYKVTLHGFYGGQRVGPVSAVGVTDPERSETMTTTQTEPPTTTPEPAPKPRLGELTVTDATPDSLSLSWTVPEGQFDHFLVQYRDGDGQPKFPAFNNFLRRHAQKWDYLVTGNEHSFVSCSALPSRLKEFSCSACCPTCPPRAPLLGLQEPLLMTTSAPQVPLPLCTPSLLPALQEAEEEEPPSPTEPSTEAPEPPEEPLLGELTVADASPDSLSLSWTVARGRFDAFTVQYKDGAGRPQVLRVGGEARAATVRGLDAGRKYKLNLYGLHQDGRAGPVSAEAVTAALPTQPPAEPLLGELAVASVTPDTVRLSWAVAEGPFDSFLVQYRDAQGQPQAVPVSGDLRQVTVSALHPARKYKFLLFGLQDGKRHGPASVDTKTLPDTNPSPRLGELTVTDTTPHSVGLAWTVPEGEFNSFVVQYKDKRGQPQIVPVAADQHKVTISGLEPNKRYKFLVYGLAGRKRLGPISAEGATAPLEETPQLPPRLGELAARGETPDSLRLSWTVAQGPFDSFLVQYRDTQGQLQAVPVAADQREFAVEGLEPGRTYEFLLYGLSGGQRLGPVSALGATAPEEDAPAPEDPEPPEAPRLGLLAVTEATPDSLRLSWSVAQGPFDSFVVQYEDTHGQPQALLVDGNQSKVVISSLEPSTSYRFFLYGLHEGKRQGPISTEGTTGPPPAGQTPGDPGPRLSRLSVTDVTTSSLRLDWEAPLGAFDSFLLRFGVPTPSTLEQRPRPPLQRELMVPGTRRWAVLRDLRPGTLYSLTLYGLRGPHKADSVQGTARTLSPVLESPRDLQLSDIRERSATVSWTPPPSRVDSFKVSYQLADGGEPQSVQVDGGAHTHRLQGLTPGARYEVTVVSVRGFEESEPLTGFLSTVPDGPTQLRALNLTEGSALLHWMPPRTPVDKYNVRVTAPGAAPLQGSAPGSAVDYPLRSLLVRTNYTATVRGLRGPNVTSPASITFTTGLQAPQDLEAKDVTPRTALLAWTEPQAPPTGYLLTFGAPGGRTQEIALPAGVTSHRLLGLFPSSRYSARLQAVWGQSLTPPLATSFTTGGLPVPFPRDCGEEMQNGGGSRATTIFLDGNRERPLSVFCDLETDGGGWLVFQRRVDGRTDFWRDWEDYAHGFGNVSGEFWLGNEALHSLTQAGDYSMRVDLRAGDEAVFAQYDSFRVDSAAQYYRLHLDGFHGTAGDSMSYHSGSVFSARDRDPNNLLISCAVSYRGAWWYRNCHYANLNGLYGSAVDHQGVTWYHWKGFDFSVPFTEMKLRPRSYRPPAQGG